MPNIYIVFGSLEGGEGRVEGKRGKWLIVKYKNYINNFVCQKARRTVLNNIYIIFKNKKIKNKK